MPPALYVMSSDYSTKYSSLLHLSTNQQLNYSLHFMKTLAPKRNPSSASSTLIACFNIYTDDSVLFYDRTTFYNIVMQIRKDNVSPQQTLFYPMTLGGEMEGSHFQPLMAPQPGHSAGESAHCLTTHDSRALSLLSSPFRHVFHNAALNSAECTPHSHIPYPSSTFSREHKVKQSFHPKGTPPSHHLSHTVSSSHLLSQLQLHGDWA